MSNKQKWARYGLIAFATMLLVIGTVVLGGMNNVNAAKHTHSYRWVVKKAATCTSEGYRNYECACGSCINSATIAKTPHTWDRGAATCTLPKKCRVCGTIGQAATGHNWNRSAASCTEDKKCRSCGAIGQRATGHSFQWVCTKAATCTTDGTKVNRCTKCSYICETQSIRHYGHHWDIQSATCTQDQKCTSCGYVNQRATGHNWDRTSATCTEPKKCKKCGKIEEKAKGHSYSWVVTKAATCTVDGVRSYKCSACGNVSSTQKIPAPGHLYNIDSATCTQAKTCAACGYVAQQATGHTYNMSSSSCTTDKKCTKCGYVAETKKGHSYAWFTTKEANCTQDGMKERRCTRCGDVSKTETIQKYGHSWNLSSATCSENKKCNRCGLVAEYAKGHTFDKTINPSMENASTHAKYCSTCKQWIGGFAHNKIGYALVNYDGSVTGQHYHICVDENGKRCGLIETSFCDQKVLSWKYFHQVVHAGGKQYEVYERFGRCSVCQGLVTQYLIVGTKDKVTTETIVAEGVTAFLGTLPFTGKIEKMWSVISAGMDIASLKALADEYCTQVDVFGVAGNLQPIPYSSDPNSQYQACIGYFAQPYPSNYRYDYYSIPAESKRVTPDYVPVN